MPYPANIVYGNKAWGKQQRLNIHYYIYGI